MKTLVAGLGALGGRLAAAFLLRGLPLRGFQRPGATLENLRNRGLRYRDGEGTLRTFALEFREDPEALRADPADLVLLTVKATQTRGAAESIARFLKEDGLVLSLQNGLGNGEVLGEILGPRRVALGTCTYGAHRDAEGTVLWGGEGQIRFGPLREGRDLREVEETLQAVGLDARVAPDLPRTLWEKVLLNATVNPVSALLGCPNETLLAHPASLRLMRNLLREGLAAARAEGIPLEEEPLWERILSVLRATASNRTSMLQDREAGKRTETDALGGALLERGQRHGLDLPATEALHLLLSALDGRQERKD